MAEVPGSDDSANRIDNSDHTDSSLSSDSIFHMEAGELYPKCDTVRDQESVSLPLKPLCGEDVKFLGQVNGGIVALSNYRFFYRSFSKDICNIISIGAIEQVEVEGLTVIKISCKDVQTFRCNFSTPESCLEWYKRLTSAIIVPKNLDEIFAFAHYAWAGEDLGDDLPPYVNEKADQNMEIESFKSEVDRMNFNVSNEGAWRISEANMEFELCKTYPPYLLVPASVSDDDLAEVAKFRSSRRVPIAVWRHHTNGAIIARCSQPEVGLFGCRSAFDEQLLQAFIDACAPSCSPELRKKLLIIDARSYSTAVTNRVRGGGCECPEYYLHCDIKFMNLPNIHAVRRSFNALQALCAMPADEASWLTGLDATRWLHYISGLLSAAVTVFSAVECNCQPVVVHCSDGWDRTPQIVSLAQILLDPYYRTVKGFQVLVEREWLAFGHKFSSRCGLTEELDERSPVFLQWLDCIQNIHKQYPCSFEFSLSFLMKLAQHIYSNLFGTFLCNSIAERKKLSVPERTFSVWKFLEQPEYRNHLYTPNGDQILFPAYNVRDLQVWRELYLGYSNGESFFAVATGLAKLDEATSIFDADNKSDKPKNDSDSLKVSALKISEAVSAWMESGVASFDSVKRDETNHGSIQSSTETLVSTDNLRETVIEEAPAESTETESENHRKTEGGNMLTYLFGGLRANSTPENPQITVTEIKDCDKVCKCIDPIDGLSSFRDDVQERLVRLTHENKEREVALEQELYNSRVDFIVEALAGRSVVGDYEQGSLCSTEVSWEALEEPVQTLWVPDHAVSHCTNCHNKFWLGRRNTTAGNVVRYFAQSVQNTLFRYQIKNFFNQ